MNPHRTSLLVLVSHPIQYFVPVYRALALRDDMDFSVLYRTRMGVDSYFDPGFGQAIQWNIPLLDGYRSQFLSSKTHLGGVEWSVLAQIIKQRPNVLLLHGYSHGTNVIALIVAKIFGARVLMRGDTRLFVHHEASPWKARLKRLLFHLVDGCVSIGTQNTRYYETLGVPSNRIYFAPFCVDNSAFALDGADSSVREVQRRKLGIAPDATVVLFAAKLVPGKRAIDLVRAIEIVRATQENLVLLIAGSGPEEHALREAAAAMGGSVLFLGFKNQAQLPEVYATADVFVLPSSNEPWGLAVNEAMAAGLPVIVSDDVGAATDLVEGKGTGLVFPVGNVTKLSIALETMLNSSEIRKRMAQNSTELIDRWSVSACVEGIARATHAVAGFQVQR